MSEARCTDHVGEPYGTRCAACDAAQVAEPEEMIAAPEWPAPNDEESEWRDG
jgi:hypothetical protein